jgi:RNA polymerase sigma-70 factor (ECF subfamily)
MESNAANEDPASRSVPLRHHPEASATDWGLLRSAAAEGPDQRSSLDAVARRYWGAIFAFARTTGASAEDAADLAQGFIADVLLGRSLLASADARRGRFRSFLRQSVLNYIRDRVRHDRSRKRSPADGPPESRDGRGLDEIPAPRQRDAEQAFDAHWAAQIVRIAAERAERRLRQEGRTKAWTAFERRTLRPQLFGDPAVPYSELVTLLELESIGQAAHQVITGRRVFVEELLAEIRATLGPNEDVAEEIKHLLAAVEGLR